MRILIALFICIALVFADQRPKEELIVVLKDASFRSALESHVFTLRNGLSVNPILPQILPPDAPKDVTQELLKYFHVIPSQELHLASIKEHFQSLEFVETAYVKPAPSLAVLPEEEVVKTQRNTSKTPLYVNRQIYLADAPAGVGQKAVWDVPGGRGDDVTVVDIEGGWDFDHEDLVQHKGKTLFGINSPQSAYKDHGSAVLGTIAGYNNDFGVTGIAPNTQIHGASVFTEKGMSYPSFGRLVIDVANYLKKGDIILIELHAPGPRCNFKQCGGQNGFIAMEYWPDNFLAFKYATEKGIIIVEAAGNGFENLDDPIYSKRPNDFPSDWKNPFNRNIADSGAIVVGAGAPPPGTHGANHGPDRSRLAFSNYGSVIDAQGWGREVTTLGYGDLQRGVRQKMYTDRFSGTSSASPVVVGVVSSIQGIAKKRGKLLTSQQARNLLRKSGSPQTDAPDRPKTQRIGNRPNLAELLKLI